MRLSFWERKNPPRSVSISWFRYVFTPLEMHQLFWGQHHLEVMWGHFFSIYSGRINTPPSLRLAVSHVPFFSPCAWLGYPSWGVLRGRTDRLSRGHDSPPWAPQAIADTRGCGAAQVLHHSRGRGMSVGSFYRGGRVQGRRKSWWLSATCSCPWFKRCTRVDERGSFFLLTRFARDSSIAECFSVCF